MKNLLKNEWLQLLILAAPFCAAALLWHKLPDRMPIHWNFRGEVDGYAGKNFGASFLPALNVVLVVLIHFLQRLDPKCRNYDAETKASIAGVFKVCRLAISLFFSALTIAIFLVALQHQFDIARFIAGGMGLMLAVMGNSMTKLRPNWFAGFRTPWSLEIAHRLDQNAPSGRTPDGRLRLGMFIESLFLPAGCASSRASLPTIILVAIVPAALFLFQPPGGKKKKIQKQFIEKPKNFWISVITTTNRSTSSRGDVKNTNFARAVDSTPSRCMSGCVQ